MFQGTRVICAIGLRGIPNVSGGIETHCEQIYTRLAGSRKDMQIIVVGRSRYIGTVAYDIQPRLRVWPLPAMRNGYLETISNTFVALIVARFRMRCDLVHLHAIGPGLLAPFARLLGFTVILTHHGSDYDRAKWNRFAKFALRVGEWTGIRAASTVICVAPSLAEKVQRRFPGRTILYIPNGADHLVPGGDQAASLIGSLGLGGGYIVSVGRLVPEKGFEDLIAAHALSGSPYKLVIVGGGSAEYEQRLKALAGPDVVFTGTMGREDVAALLASARLFVLASHHEGLPIAALEAGAMGANLLLSDIPANVDLGLPAENYYPTGDRTALAEKLTQDPARFGSHGLLDRFTWDNVTRETGAVYDTIFAAKERS